MLTTPLEEWDRTLDINLRGAFLTAKAAAPLLRRPGGGMVFVSSGLAINVEPGFSAYTSSKAGLLGFVKVLAKELAPDIRVNAVAPGLVATPFLTGGTGQGVTPKTGGSLDDWFGSKERAQAMRDAIPMRRIADPDDIVAPILFLLAPAHVSSPGRRSTSMAAASFHKERPLSSICHPARRAELERKHTSHAGSAVCPAATELY